MPTFPPLPPLTVGDQTIDGTDVRKIREAIIELRNASLDAARFDYAVPLSLGIAVLGAVADAMGSHMPGSDLRPADCHFRLSDKLEGYPARHCTPCGKPAEEIAAMKSCPLVSKPKPKPRYDRDEPAKPDPRPANCRFRLRDEGQPYPKSGCQACGRNVATGLGDRCHYIERDGAPGV